MKLTFRKQESLVLLLVASLSIAMLVSVAASARVGALVDRSSSCAYDTEEVISLIDEFIAFIDSRTELVPQNSQLNSSADLESVLHAFEAQARKSSPEAKLTESMKKRFNHLISAVPFSNLRLSEIRAELLKLKKVESAKVLNLMSEWHKEAFLLSIFVALIQLLSILTLVLCVFFQNRLQAQKLTAQKTAFELAKLVEFSQESILSVDLNLKVRSWNPGSEKMFGRKTDLALGSSLRNWIKKETDASTIENAIKSGKTSSFEIEMKKADEKSFFASISISPIECQTSDSSASHTIVISDVSQQVNLRIQQADFIASLTHDLKNPIIANNLVLKEFVYLEAIESQKTRELIERVIASNEQIIDMLTAMLDLYKVNAGKFRANFMPILLPKLLADCVECFEQRALFKNIEIITSTELLGEKYQSDPLILKKIILNLLDNALKYAPINSKVVVSVDDKKEGLIIAVEDSGPGINDSRIAELFSVSSIQQNSEPLAHSTGLGLYLVKQLCILIEAEISYLRSASGMSRFELRLPKDPPKIG